MNLYLLLHRSLPTQQWATIGDYPTQADARAAGAERAKSIAAGDLAVAQIQAAYTTTIAVTLTQIAL